jgi:hypothetical protein
MINVRIERRTEPGSEADGCYCYSADSEYKVKAHPQLTANVMLTSKRKSPIQL